MIFGKKNQFFVLFNLFKFAVSFVHILDLAKCSVTPPEGTLFRFYIACLFLSFHEINGYTFGHQSLTKQLLPFFFI